MLRGTNHIRQFCIGVVEALGLERLQDAVVLIKCGIAWTSEGPSCGASEFMHGLATSLVAVQIGKQTSFAEQLIRLRRDLRHPHNVVQL
jgi:hypothetical protein